MNFDYPHRRFNPLTREWVLVSPHRAKRPWLGQVEKVPHEAPPAYDPQCLLCPGNTRINGEVNPRYTDTFVFTNDFPAVLTPEKMGPDAPANPVEILPEKLFAAQPVTGICRVVCFSPRHDLSLPELSQAEVESIVRTWRDQTVEIGAHDFVNYVQVFENKGETMGCSNPHPHSQIWSTSEIPTEPAKELAAQSAYLRENKSCLLCDYVEIERQSGERVVCENAHFTAVAPFWAVWPFELMIVSHRHVGSLAGLSEDEIGGLANILRRVTARYDNLFEVSFPYSMGFHQSPTDGLPHEECHLHLHFYPPLLRSATVRKFMVGFELLGMPQRDITPETAAARLRAVSEVHYRRHIAM
ncbi:MAG: UDP-glucose--hexose-1-phosphate uridylyltransferase [Chloroflexota bacterium]